MENLIGNIIQDMDEESESYKILKDLMDCEENLELKTEIKKTYHFSVLDVLITYLEENNLPKTAKLLDNFRVRHMKYLISKDRKGRKEIIEGLSKMGGNLGTNDMVTAETMINKKM